MLLRFIVLALLGIAAACERTAEVQHRIEGRFGSVAIYRPIGPPNGVVFLFSDGNGWGAALDRVADQLAKLGIAVAGIDLPAYLRGLAASQDGCHYLISEVEDLSKRLQRELGFAGYQSPILAGFGAGGTLAYAALAQSPAATVAGAVSVDPAPSLATTVPLCPGAPSEAVKGGGFGYGVAAHLPGWWVVSPPDAVAAPLRALATPGAVDGAPTERLLALLRARIGVPSTQPNPLADLPLVELPAAHHGAVMAVIYSGDGGWRDLDKTIGEQLAHNGVSVVGVDCLRYFWRAKTPDEVAGDLTRIIRTFTREWGTSKVVLIGYSFGAGILPFAYNRLPADVREQVVQVSLLGVEPRASFEFKIAGWIGAAPGADAPAVLPELQRFPPGLLQCVYGEEEENTLCRDPALSGAEIVRTTGGHHFDGNYAALAQKILAAAHRRLGTS